MENKKKRKQLTIDITQEIHQQIKVLSALKNVSMTCWVIRAINDRIAKESHIDMKDKPKE